MTVRPLLPDVTDPRSEPFWDGLRHRQLRLQMCASCGYVRWPAAPRCPECLAPGGDWTEIAPEGTVWSYAVYHRAFHPSLEGEVPYTIVATVLDTGPMMLARWSSADSAAPIVGERVCADYENIDAGVTLLRWRRAD